MVASCQEFVGAGCAFRVVSGAGLFELFFEPLIDALANVVGKVVRGVGIFGDELVFRAEELKNGLRRGDALADAGVVEVGVV
jgi:hypothetical protein